MQKKTPTTRWGLESHIHYNIAGFNRKVNPLSLEKLFHSAEGQLSVTTKKFNTIPTVPVLPSVGVISSNNTSRTVGDKIIAQAIKMRVITIGWEHWHYSQVNRLGPTRYLELADLAAKSYNPPKRFSKLLKEA